MTEAPAPPVALLRTLVLALWFAVVLALSGLATPPAGPGIGADLLLGHLADPGAAAMARAGGLALVALTLALFPRLVPAGALGRGLLLALLAGLVLVVPTLLPPWATGPSVAARLPLVGGGLVLLALVARLGSSAPATSDGPDAANADDPTGTEHAAADTDDHRSPLPEVLAGLLGGAGIALALGALWRRLTLFGYHEPAEDHLRLAVLLAMAAVGSLAFAPLLASSATGRRWAALLGPSLTALGALAGLWLLAPVTSKAGLTSLLAAFGDLDLSALGGTTATAVVAARALVAVGFALGLTLGAAFLSTRRVGLANLALGAALGTWAWPVVVERAIAPDGPLAMQLALAGLALAALGALPLALGGLLRGPAPLRAALPVLTLVVACGWLVPRDPVTPISPWGRLEVDPEWQRDTALGFLTVEPTADPTPALVLDRVQLTPPADEAAGDAARLVAALDLAAANWQPGDPDLQVLLAGQLTLARLEAFDAWERAHELDADLAWTTPWHAWQDELRPLLEPLRLPDPVPFEAAREAVGTGTYDLVVVPQVYGTQLPALEAADTPRATPPGAAHPARTSKDQPAVAWLTPEAPLAAADLGPAVLLAGSDLDHLGLGLVSGLTGDHLTPSGARTRAPHALARLGGRTELRPIRDRADTFARLGPASSDPLVAALAGFFQDQERSSPWEEPDERLELDQARLEALAAATEVPLTPLASATWEHLARVLITKRLSGETFAVVPGLLDRLDSFPPLEHALARAYCELLMPAEGAALLRPLFEAGWRAPEPLMDLAWALGDTGDWAGAAEVYDAVLQVMPGFHHAARLRAMAAMRAGLPEATALVQDLLEEDPDDGELARFLQPGPLPAPPGFDPVPLAHAGDDGHDH